MKHLVIIESPATGAGIRLIELALAQEHRVTLYTMRAEMFRCRFSHSNFEAVPCEVYSDDLASMIRKRLSPDEPLGIVSTYDRCLVRWAELAEQLGVPGPSVEAMRRCVSKVQQNEHLQRYGLRSAESVQVLPREVGQASLLENLRYPVVVKPENGFASTGVRLCNGPAQVREHLELMNALRGSSLDTRELGSMLLEPFVDGPEYCVEMYDEKLVGIVRKYCVENHNEFLEAGYACTPRLPIELVLSLQGVALRALEALGVDRGAAHIDVRISSQGPYVVEVNPRVAGGVISELVRHTYGFDFVRALFSSAFDASPCAFKPEASGRASAAGFIGSWEVAPHVKIPSGSYTMGDVYIEYKSQIVPSRARVGVIYVNVPDQMDPWKTLASVKQRLLHQWGATDGDPPVLAGNWDY